jgi:hypothetical protein
LGAAGAAAALATNAYGYVMTLPAFPGARTFTGNSQLLVDDQMSGALPIGFDFVFYGETYNTVYVSSNGFLDFDGGNHGCCDGRQIPVDDNFNNIIAGNWTDLNPSIGGGIFYDTLGAPGSREFIVAFRDVPTSNGFNLVTFDMVLHEGTNDIELVITSGAGNVDLSFVFPLPSNSLTVGIENADGTQGLQSVHGGGIIVTNLAILYSAPEIPEPAPDKIAEPATMGLFGLALLGLGAARRRMKRVA